MKTKTVQELCDEANLRIDAFAKKMNDRFGKLTVRIVIKDETADYMLAYMRDDKSSSYTLRIKQVNAERWQLVTGSSMVERVLAMMHFRELYDAGVQKEAELCDLLTKGIAKMDADEELK